MYPPRLKQLDTHSDDRGFLREIAQVEFSQCQLTWTTTYPGVIKAFHMHERQIDIWCCVSGEIEVVLVPRHAPEKVARFYLGESNPSVLEIPPNTWHGYRVLGNEPATLIYLTSMFYDPESLDEKRAPFDAFDVKWETVNR